MPRIRTLKPEHKQHRKIGPLPDFAYRLWVGLITESDDEGRLVADAAQINATVFPYRPRPLSQIQAGLELLAARGLIVLYRVANLLYVALHDWPDHQKIHKHHFTPSKLPLPHPESEEVPYQSRTSPVPVPPDLDRIGSDRKGSDRKGGESEGRGPASAPESAPAPPQATHDSPGHDPPNPSPLGPELREFMATLRRAAASPLPGPVPPRGTHEAV